MVTESIIEKAINSFDQEEHRYEETLLKMLEDHPILSGFLTQESFDILTEEEKDIMWYIVVIIITSVYDTQENISALSEEALVEAEEQNWEIYENQRGTTFQDRVTVFFEGYAQEDLLAFVEDTLYEDDDSPITNIGREVIFIAAKSIVDVLLSQSQEA